MSKEYLSKSSLNTINDLNDLAGSFIDQSHKFLCNPDVDAAVMVWRLSDLILSGAPCHSITCTVIVDELIDPKLFARSYDDAIHYRIYRLLANITSHAVVIDAEDESIYSVLEETMPINNLVLVSFNDNSSSNEKVLNHINKKGKVLAIADNNGSDRKTLVWNDGKNSHIISDRFKPSRSLLFSLAAMLVVNESVDQLQRAVAPSAYHRSFLNSNSLAKL